MSCIRVLSLRQLPTQTVVVSRHSPSPPKHHAATRNFTSTRIRAFNPPQLPESVVKAVRNTKAWNAIGQNPELQQIFLETLQVLKDEGVDPVKPSMMAMLTSSKVREQLKKVSEAMQTSGIDMASLKELQEAMAKVVKEEEAKKK